jgi:DHA1 family bicyclomycin/chloramphenicol resistance-like MFS transporter
LTAVHFALVALSIDAVLPALPDMGRDLQVARANDVQLIVSMLLLGSAFGQLLYGPVSDTIGRKPAVYVGIGLYLVGCVMSLFAASMTVMLAGRILQGFGVAAPRTVIVAMVRDQYEGAAMARVMSFVMAVFILVPTIAPSIGQGVLLAGSWRLIFGFFFLFALFGLVWFALRQPETLKTEHQMPFSLRRITTAIASVFTNRIAFGYIITTGMIFGAFLGYLSSAQQVFQEHYGLGSWFAVYFALLALAIGAASLTNAKLVMRFGVRPLTWRALIAMTGLSLGFLGLLLAWPTPVPLWATTVYFLAAFFCIGILFGNLNALAMEPLGHIAGTGSAVIGAMTSFISLPLGIAIGQAYNDSAVPLVGGFAVLGVIACLTMSWTERKRRH